MIVNVGINMEMSGMKGINLIQIGKQLVDFLVADLVFYQQMNLLLLKSCDKKVFYNRLLWLQVYLAQCLYRELPLELKPHLQEVKSLLLKYLFLPVLLLLNYAMFLNLLRRRNLNNND